MSWSKSVTVWCDSEGCPEWHDGEGSNAIGGMASVTEARRRGRMVGWAFRSGNDLCPEHADI